uniref:EP300 interacting inhibitor of differentiation 2 n=1 Tax=Equus asinus asinus TaxID=83772 RepID=A0A8C4LV20_EQUAS
MPAEPTPRSAMSELPADSDVSQTDAASGNSDVPRAEVGGGRREPAGEGPMAAPGAAPMAAPGAAPMGPEGRPRSGPENSPGGAAALPYLRLRPPVSAVGMNSQQFLRLSLDHRPLAPRRMQEPAERRRRLADACAARGAALDARYQRNPQRMDFDLLTFTVALTASEVINPLIEELGCDKFIPRE